ncbi:MAG TPA: DUF4114 domain-containing protein, partial [Clostridia bacterium]|nr:DUF4114 domain-containing protein [Clostridia bacterium]
LYEVLGFANNTALESKANLPGTYSVSGNERFTSLLIEYAGFKNVNTFGVYTKIGSTISTLEVYPGVANGNPLISKQLVFDTVGMTIGLAGSSTTIPLNSTGIYGFYMRNGDGVTFYTDKTLNPDAKDHAVSVGVLDTKYGKAPYTLGNTGFILGWEDKKIGGGADRDYQDLVVSVTSLPIPEPTTVIAGALLLLPFGVSTLRVIRNNRKA